MAASIRFRGGDEQGQERAREALAQAFAAWDTDVEIELSWADAWWSIVACHTTGSSPGTNDCLTHARLALILAGVPIAASD